MEEVKPPSALRSRVITGAILVAVMVSVLVMSAYSCFGRWVLTSVAVAAVAVCSFEFARFMPVRMRGQRGLYALIVGLPAATVYVSALSRGLCGEGRDPLGLAIAYGSGVAVSALLATLCIVVSGRVVLQNAREVGAEILPAFVLISCGGGTLVGLAALPRAAWVVAWLVAVVALNDTAAYFGGSKIGGTKLAPALSPKKTVSGSICGLAAGGLFGFWAQSWLGVTASPLFFLFFALLTVAAAQIGDLMKSYLKRVADVKDSGAWLPGHGGLLDRIDGELLAGPLVYFALLALGL